MFLPETPAAVETTRSPAFPEMRSIRAVPAEQSRPVDTRRATNIFFMGSFLSVVRFGGKADLIDVKDFGHGSVDGILVKLDDVVAVCAGRGSCDMAVEIGDVSALAVIVGEADGQPGVIRQMIAAIFRVCSAGICEDDGSGGQGDPFPVQNAKGSGAAGREHFSPAVRHDTLSVSAAIGIPVCVVFHGDVSLRHVAGGAEIHLILSGDLLPVQEIAPDINRGGACLLQKAEIVVVIGAVQLQRGAELFQIVGAGNPARPLPGLVQRRQQHRRQNGDDRDHYYDNLLNIQYGVY